MRTIAALVMAAGQARRFQAEDGDSKVLADLDGCPLVRRVASTALRSRATPVVVVTGHAAAAVAAAVADLPVRIVQNAAYADGMASSLAAGLAAVPAETNGALILLADMPLVRVATLDRLIDCFEDECDGTEAIVPTFAGRRGNPVLISRRLFSEVARLRGDEGARALLAQPSRSVAFYAVDDAGIEIDVDTRAALERLRTWT